MNPSLNPLLIVEDEPIAARTLQRLLLEAWPQAEVEAPLASVAAAIERLRRPPLPGLLLLDVQLADGLSFEIFEALPVASRVVFATAYDAYALKAFELGGIDYLLKPIDPRRLAQALQRAAARTPDPAALVRGIDHYRGAARQWKSRFLVQQGDSLQSIPLAEIAWFQLDLVPKLVTRDGRRLLLPYESLDEIEPLLDPRRFFRLSRRCIAQIDAVARASRLFKGRLAVELLPPCAEEIVVSQGRAAAFRSWWEGEAAG